MTDDKLQKKVEEEKADNDNLQKEEEADDYNLQNEGRRRTRRPTKTTCKTRRRRRRPPPTTCKRRRRRKGPLLRMQYHNAAIPVQRSSSVCGAAAGVS